LSLALALAHEPLVLFLDEPTAGLDVGTRVELHRIMKEQKERGATILLATHDMAEAEEIADRIGILLRGNLVATGTPMEITATGSGLTKVSVRTEKDCLAKDGRSFPAVDSTHQKDEYYIFFSVDIGPTVAAIIQFVEAKGDRLIDLRVERPSLEDRFLEITTQEVTQ
jgi:ABC-2 type transport system ATP-binding protein